MHGFIVTVLYSVYSCLTLILNDPEIYWHNSDAPTNINTRIGADEQSFVTWWDKINGLDALPKF